jgi:hypothetical protein
VLLNSYPSGPKKERDMSNRLPIIDNLCTNPENHKAHMCQLKSAGKLDEVERLARNPAFICGNCGHSSNTEGALCAPGPLEK